MRGRLTCKIILALVIAAFAFIHKVSAYGEYYYLAEDPGFGNSTFVVNKNITVFENGAVLQEEWKSENSPNWTVYLDYWEPNANLFDKPLNRRQDGYQDSAIVIKEAWQDSTNPFPIFLDKQSKVNFEMIEKKFNQPPNNFGINITYIPNDPKSNLPLLRADVYDAGKNGNSACVIIPGYQLGVFSSESGENNGWNNGGGPSGSYKYVTDSVNKGYESSPIVVISYNTHEDYDGRGYKSSTSDNQEYNAGTLWGDGGPNSGNSAALDKALYLLQNRLGIDLDSCRIVSHSTGHYLAKKMLNEIPVKEYWALSPNTRGSTLIRTIAWLKQKYYSWEDMLRHKYEVPEEGITKDFFNSCIVDLAELPVINDSTDANFLLSHGDASTGGQSGWGSGITSNMGVVSYSKLQYTGDLHEINRRTKFLKYEALNNLNEMELKNFKKYNISIWDNRADISEGWKTYMKEIFSDFMEDVMEHIDLDQRMEVVADGNHKLGAPDPAEINYCAWDIANKGVKIKWQAGADNTSGNTEGYEIVRRIEGEKYGWKLDTVSFGASEFTDNLELEIVEMEKVGSDSTKITFKKPMIAYTYNDEYTDSSLIGRKIAITSEDKKYSKLYEIYANEGHTIWCKDNLIKDGVRSKKWREDNFLYPKGDLFVVRDIKYEYSVWTWGANGRNLDKKKGVFLPIRLGELPKEIGGFKPAINLETVPCHSNNYSGFSFKASSEEFGIAMARYKIDNGEWIDLLPIDGIYDSTEEKFSVAISVLADGNHKLEVIVFDDVADEAIADTTFTIDRTPPLYVQNFTAQPGDSTITLAWINPTDVDFSSTKIYRLDTVDTTLCALYESIITYNSATVDYDSFTYSLYKATKINNLSDTSAVDINLSNGRRYYYAAYGYDSALNNSNVVLTTGVPRRDPKDIAFLMQTWNGFGDPNVLYGYRQLEGILFSNYAANRIDGDRVSLHFYSNSSLGESDHATNYPITYLRLTDDFDSARRIISQMNESVNINKKVYNTNSTCGTSCHQHDNVAKGFVPHTGRTDCQNCHSSGTIAVGTGMSKIEKELMFAYNKKRVIAFSSWNDFTWSFTGTGEEPGYMKYNLEYGFGVNAPVIGIDYTKHLNSDSTVNYENYLSSRASYQYNAERIETVLKRTGGNQGDLRLYRQIDDSTYVIPTLEEQDNILGLTSNPLDVLGSPYLKRGERYTKSFDVEDGLEGISLTIWGNRGLSASIYGQ